MRISRNQEKKIAVLSLLHGFSEKILESGMLKQGKVRGCIEKIKEAAKIELEYCDYMPKFQAKELTEKVIKWAEKAKWLSEYKPVPMMAAFLLPLAIDLNLDSKIIKSLEKLYFHYAKENEIETDPESMQSFLIFDQMFQ